MDIKEKSGQSNCVAAGQQRQQQPSTQPPAKPQLSSGSSGFKGPLITQTPAFKYFHTKDQFTKNRYDLSQASRELEVGRKLDAKKMENDEGITLKHFATIPRRTDSSSSSEAAKDPVVRDAKLAMKLFTDTLNSNNNSCKSNDVLSSTVLKHITQDSLTNNDKNRSANQTRQLQKANSDITTATTQKSTNNDNTNSSRNNADMDKTEVSVAKLIKQHSDEIQSNSHWKRFAGNDKYKWFFRSLRGERTPKLTEEGGDANKSADCPRCRLASLNECQFERRIEELQSGISQKVTQVERLSSEMSEKESKLAELGISFNRITAENNELKASINRLISEQIFGQRVLLGAAEAGVKGPHMRQTGGQSNQKLNAARLKHSTSLGVKSGHARFQVIPDWLAEQVYGDDNDHDYENVSSRRSVPTKSYLYTPVHSAGDDESVSENSFEGRSALVDKHRGYYPDIKPKPTTYNTGQSTLKQSRHRRTGQISMADREWHSTEAFVSTAHGAHTGVITTGVTAVDVKVKREAKSSLDLDDSLYIEYPSRTFRQQMECMKGVIQSVDSLKSDPTGGRLKSRRRRDTVASVIENNSRLVENYFTRPNTRKLSNYLLEQQQGQLTKAISSDLLYSPKYAQPKQQLEYNHRNYIYDNNNHDNANTSPTNNTNSNNNNNNYYRAQSHPYHNNKYIEQIAELQESIDKFKTQRTGEHRGWMEEKMRVIEYQKKLQDAYIEVVNQCKSLETQLRKFKNLV